MSAAMLRQDLRVVLEQLNSQIRVIREKAKSMNIEAEQLQTPDGNYVLAPLLSAKAHALSGLAYLSEKK